MKLIKRTNNLYSTIRKENNLGFVPTMGCIHKGHESLIKISKKRCKKTLVSIFVNPTQFNDKKDYRSYPKNINKDLKTLKKLKVDFVYLPTVNQIYKKKLSKIVLKKSQKILCAKFRKGHFEGVIDVLDRFIRLISPKIIFMGEKDYQQYFLVKNFISKRYHTNIYRCKTIRDSNGLALSSRNILLDKKSIKTAGLIANKLIKLKHLLKKKNKHRFFDTKKLSELIKKTKLIFTNKFNIKIEYLECRNLINLNNNIHNKPFKIFIAYYLNNVRLIDNF
jgi:pantoate--beta-alanine ligase